MAWTKSANIKGPKGDTGLTGPQGPVADVEVGSIKPWPAAAAPASWMLCNGAAVSRTLYPELFSLIGSTYGPGDGSTTFNLPDMRGRFVLGMGQGAGLADRVLAAIGGEETHQLTLTELAAHNHVATQPAHQHQAGSNNFTYTGGGAGPVYSVTNPPGSAPWVTGFATPTIAVQNAGGNTAHNNMPPFLVITYIIKVSPTGGATAQAPIADSTQSGLLRQVSGLRTDVVVGDNTCRSLPVALFDSPDVAFINPGAFDDHFDGATLDPKWQVVAPTAGMIGTVIPTIIGSTLNFGGGAPSGDVGTLYTQSVLQALPNTTRFELSMCVDVMCLVNSVTGTNNSVAQLILRLENTAGTAGVEVRFSSYCMATDGTVQQLCGIDMGTGWTIYYNGFCSVDIRYVKFAFNPSDSSCQVYYSKNGKVWFPYGALITGAQSGFTSTPPNKFRFYQTVQRNAFAMLSVDWIKFMNT
jgi:microcystin-dependent protein